MQYKILKNGLRVIYVEKESNTVCILANVFTGSNSEDRSNAGISHFIEHMLFEGTEKRKDSFAVSNEIESLGGDLNAATSNERTFYYVRVLNKHFDIASDVLSDILFHPSFEPTVLKKEKRVIIDEIKLVNDQPRYYQWILFQNTLFKKHPARNAVYGTIDTINGLTRSDVLAYYRAHYKPNNMTLVIVGKVPGVFDKVERQFDAVAGPVQTARKVEEPVADKPTIKRLQRKTLQSYLVLGYKTPPRHSRDSYTLDVIRGILGRGQSGKIFNEIRTKRGLAYDVGVLHNPSTDFGYFAIYVNTNKKNVPAVQSIILDELQALSRVTEKELEEAKTFLEGEYLLQAEDNQKLADLMAFWSQTSNAEAASEYIGRIQKVTRKDVASVVKKYFKNQTMVVIS
jgi:predicted Zn-dependent peptidase